MASAALRRRLDSEVDRRTVNYLFLPHDTEFLLLDQCKEVSVLVFAATDERYPFPNGPGIRWKSTAYPQHIHRP